MSISAAKKVPTKTFTITLPDGSNHKIRYSQSTDKKAVAEELLAEWGDYCKDNWMDEGRGGGYGSSEAAVKRFLDGVSTFLLLEDKFEDAEYTVLTERKNRTIREKEVLFPGTWDGTLETKPHGISVEDAEQIHFAKSAFDDRPVYNKPRNPHPSDGAFLRINEFKSKHPDAIFTFYRVDTENSFVKDGVKYIILPKVTGYRGKKTRSGMRYDMDTIMAADTKDGKTYFLDQYGNQIPSENVTREDETQLEHDQLRTTEETETSHDA